MLNDLLGSKGSERVDFLSMDIELGEPGALAGFELGRFRPALVCIEASKAVRAEILAYFGAHGYERIEQYLPVDHVNGYFRPVPSVE